MTKQTEVDHLEAVRRTHIEVEVRQDAYFDSVRARRAAVRAAFYEGGFSAVELAEAMGVERDRVYKIIRSVEG